MESGIGGREKRFTELYERWYGSVYAYAARRIGRESADEIAAETFLIAWRRFELLPSEPLPWLYGVARNVIMRQLVAGAREGRTLAAVANELAVSRGAGGDGASDPRLAAAWQRLSARDREVLALVAWEELSVPDAAAALGCSAPAFSVRLHRARRRLARLLTASKQTSSSPLSEVRS
ncbi:MAG: RNA polymerase sigma factor [Solirubrobacteraceae bacterium]